MKTIDFSYFIERYNAGDMSDAEKEWFQKELEGNEKLRNEVILRKRTDVILKDKNVMSLRNKLAEIENATEKNPAGKSFKENSLHQVCCCFCRAGSDWKHYIVFRKDS